MTTEHQTEALQLADRLEREMYVNGSGVRAKTATEAAAELRRLQAENDALRVRVEALTQPTISGIEQIMLIAGNYAAAWSAAQGPTSEDVFEWLDAERKALEEAIRQFAAAPQADAQKGGA